MEKKYTCHVPIEQYGFISCELEGTAEDALEAYQELSHAKDGGTGISMKEFNTFFDSYVNTGHAPENGMEVWERMSLDQKKILNEFKKCLARIKPKQ